MATSGINEAIPYVEIRAEQAKTGIGVYDASGGKVTTGGLYVLWDRDTGFTGTGWYNEGSQSPNFDSPAWGYSDEAILAEIDAQGNLNNMFNAWKDKIEDFTTRYNFILDVLPSNCVEEA